MAGLTPTQQQQHNHLTGSAASVTTSVSAASGDEDASKSNTDCVYFLASPLTCKKGSECEYRHSEIARVNPRDCYYWMNGNCLNPKCGFRHPPLEGLLGAQGPSPVGALVPPSQAASTPVAPASFGSGPGKQPVPCMFFQKGYCMKGDWCPFLHAPLNSVTNKVLLSQAPATTAEPPTLKKPFGGPVNITQQKLPPRQVNVPNAVDLPVQAKPMPRVGYTPTKDEPSKERKHPAASVGDELSRKRNSGILSVDNGSQVNWSSRVQQPVSLKDNISMNSKDAEEEISREPSPGFDVLVDNELEDSVYYPTEDQFGRPDNGDEYFDNHTGDYNSIVDTEPDNYHETRGYDSYERHPGQYAWEQRRSSERALSGLTVNRERSRRSRTRSPDPVHDSDLRYHLSKHSRTSCLKSVIHRDNAHERPDHRSYQKSQRGDMHRDHERRDNSVGSRLRGRIKMPVRSSSDSNELQRGRNTEWQRPQTGHFQQSSRLGNRINDIVGVNSHNDNRNNRSPPIRRETRNVNSVDFAGPKRLSELKSQKSIEANDHHVNHQTSDGKRKYSKVEEYSHDAEGDLSFDGPKPLKEILKRKRVDDKVDSGFQSSDVNNLNYTRDKKEDSVINHADKGEQETENEISKPALLTDKAEVEGREVIVEDGEVGGDEDVENYGAEDDGDYYEQVDGEGEGEEAYELDEGDNGGDPEGEYLDEDDDDDDFAKKMGVMY